ncbi:MAG: MarR family transcriptional regulator [Herpetosiphonaceae bacterium]|nr:MarR family transcriptional regulator [Herpetosiphonaceae bacterium]
MQHLPPAEFRVVRSRADIPVLDDTPDRQLFVIEDTLGYLINFVAKLVARAQSACLAQHEVTLGQWPILLFLWVTEGLTQTELSRHVVIDDATMVRTLDRMERDGLVQRVRNPQDRRQLNIFLTDKGRSLRDVLIPCALAVNTTALQSLDDSEQRQLSSLLRRVITSLEPAALDDNASSS